jgi:hypothetical protein
MESPVNDAIVRFQAKWQLGFIPPELAPAAATELLQSGIVGRPLTILAGLTSPSRIEVEPLVRRFLVEAGAAPMSDVDARWLLVRAGAQAIAAGSLAPREGVVQLAFLCRELGMPERLRDFVDLSAGYDPNDSRCDDRIRAVATKVLSTLRRSPRAAT